MELEQFRFLFPRDKGTDCFYRHHHHPPRFFFVKVKFFSVFLPSTTLHYHQHHYLRAQRSHVSQVASGCSVSCTFADAGKFKPPQRVLFSPSLCGGSGKILHLHLHFTQKPGTNIFISLPSAGGTLRRERAHTHTRVCGGSCKVKHVGDT